VNYCSISLLPQRALWRGCLSQQRLAWPAPNHPPTETATAPQASSKLLLLLVAVAGQAETKMLQIVVVVEAEARVET